MTKDQTRRVFEAIEETERFLEKEMAYQPHLQNADMIDFYQKHLTKLRGMLANETH